MTIFKARKRQRARDQAAHERAIASVEQVSQLREKVMSRGPETERLGARLAHINTTNGFGPAMAELYRRKPR